MGFLDRLLGREKKPMGESSGETPMQPQGGMEEGGMQEGGMRERGGMEEEHPAMPEQHPPRDTDSPGSSN